MAKRTTVPSARKVRERYVALSGKNLKRCVTWADAHPEHPLSVAFWSACGGLLDDEQELQIRKSLPGGEDTANIKRWIAVHDKVHGAAGMGFEYRDAIGRLILLLAPPCKPENSTQANPNQTQTPVS
jgi:hypothetical protein